jgi:hypothetical protein
VLLAAASCRGAPDSAVRPSGSTAALDGAARDTAVDPTMPTPDNAIARIERVTSSPALGGHPGVEITLTSSREFPVRSEIATLRIGARSFTLSRYASGDLHTLVFTLTPEELDALDDGAAVWVQYGSDAPPPAMTWSFGPLQKARLQ